MTSLTKKNPNQNFFIVVLKICQVFRQFEQLSTIIGRKSLKWMWSQMYVVTNVCGHKCTWSQMYVVSNVRGLKCTWSQMYVVSNECGLKWMWSQMNVVSNERGLKWTWSEMNVVWNERGLKWSGHKQMVSNEYGLNCLHTDLNIFTVHHTVVIHPYTVQCVSGAPLAWQNKKNCESSEDWSTVYFPLPC